MGIKRAAVQLLGIGVFLVACQSDEGSSSDSQQLDAHASDSQQLDAHASDGQPLDAYVRDDQPPDAHVPDGQPLDAYIRDGQPLDEPNICTAMACGGDIVGRWDVVKTCLSPNDEPLNWDLCPAARVRLTLESSGTASFDVDGAYTITLTTLDTMTITIPAFCLSEGFDCSDFEQMFESQPDEPDLTCIHEDLNSPCICTGVIEEVGMESGAYTTADEMVTFYPGVAVEAGQSTEEQPQDDQSMGPSCRGSNESCDGNSECASDICAVVAGGEICAPRSTACSPACSTGRSCVDVGNAMGLCLDHLDNPTLEPCVVRENESEDFEEEEGGPFNLEYCATDHALSLIIRGEGYDPDVIFSFTR